MYGADLVAAVENFINGKSSKIHTIITDGNRGHFHDIDKTDKYQAVLEHLKIDYTIGNDAPKGGKKGKYIEIKCDKDSAKHTLKKLKEFSGDWVTSRRIH